MKSVCQNCGKTWNDSQLSEFVKDIFQRVAPGEPMPSGECPACGALCQPVKPEKKAKKDKQKEKALAACKQLIHAYATGSEDGGSVDWADIDLAYELALEAMEK